MHRVTSAIKHPEFLVALTAFGLSAAAAAWIIRPIHAGTLGYDAAASVLYFQRMLSGHQLEAFVGATPKALLTGVYGLAYGLVPDWRIISWVAIMAYASGIAASSVLAYRLAGIVAAAFVAVGMIGSTELLKDVDLAYAVSWALLCWAIAGLLVSGSRPRYAWAGIVLAIGGLARFETLIIVALAGFVLVVGASVARIRRRPTAAYRVRAPILLGLLAIPLQAAHDWVLTGDALYAAKVPVLGSVGLPLVGVGGVLRSIGSHYAAEPVLIVLAVIGILTLCMRAKWDIAVGLVALTAGVMAFLMFLAFRQVYVSGRYIAPADVALIFSAGIGIASLRVPTIEALMRDRSWDLRPLAMIAVAGSVAALAIVRPFGPFDGATRSAIAVNSVVHRDIDQVVPDLRRAVSDAPAIRDWPDDGSPTRAMGERAAILAPILTVPQLAVDLHLPLSSISGTVGSSIRSDGTYPRSGQIVFHHVDRDQPPEAFDLFEVDRTTANGSITVDPLRIDPDQRYWVVRIGP